LNEKSNQQELFAEGGEIDLSSDDLNKPAFGFYRKQRATPSSPETKAAMDATIKEAAKFIIPQDVVDLALLPVAAGKVGAKTALALLAATGSSDADAGFLKKLLMREAPNQADQIRQALRQSADTGLEHSVIGPSNAGPVGEITRGNQSSVTANQFDIRNALRSNQPIVDFHTHPGNYQAAFDVAPSQSDFRFYSNEYFPGEGKNELRTIITAPGRRPAYSFFATNNPGKVFNKASLSDATFELQNAGRKGLFKSVIDDPRFVDYFDGGGTIGDLAENLAPLSILDLRKSQGLGRGDLRLSGRPISMNSTNVELFNLMNPKAVELLTKKKFAKGGLTQTKECSCHG
jgi:hypothetical protein